MGVLAHPTRYYEGALSATYEVSTLKTFVTFEPQSTVGRHSVREP